MIEIYANHIGEEDKTASIKKELYNLVSEMNDLMNTVSEKNEVYFDSLRFLTNSISDMVEEHPWLNHYVCAYQNEMDKKYA